MALQFSDGMVWDDGQPDPYQQPAPLAAAPQGLQGSPVPRSLGYLTQHDPGAAIGVQTQDTVNTRQQTQDYINNILGPAVTNGNAANEGTRQSLSDASGQLWNATQGYIGQNKALGQQAQGVADRANAEDQWTLGQYTGANNTASDLTAGLFGNMVNGYGQFSQLSASPYVGDAMSNPGDVARQSSAFDQLQGIGNGSLNYASQGAQAYANPQDINNQNQALGFFQGGMAGSLGYASQAANAYASQADYDRQADAALLLERGSKGFFNTASQGANVYADQNLVNQQEEAQRRLNAFAQGGIGTQTQSQGAQAYADAGADQQYRDAIGRLGGVVNAYGTSAQTANDGAGLGAQKDALSQFKALSNPEVTAQERFIYEQARMRQEQDERNSRQAVVGDLRARGMSGSGMELGNMQGLQQQQSQNRLLSDLGAQSNAVSRSMQALQGYGNLGTNMQQQAQQALALYTDAAGQLRSQTFDEAYKRGLAGDQTAIANANRMLQAAGMSSDAAAALRNTAFNEAAYRANSADVTNTNNANRQLQAAGMNADMSTNMRNQGFNEAFQRGNAADTASQFNSQMKLSSGAQAANLSTNMRNAGFNEAYSRGIAADNASANNQRTSLQGSLGAAQQSNAIRDSNDVMSRFNQGQRQISQQFTDQYAANQQTDAANRLRDMTITGEGLVNDNFGRATDLANARTSTTGTAAARNNKVIDFNAGRNDANIGASQSWNSANLANAGLGANIAQNGISNNLALGQLSLGNSWTGLGAQGQAINGGVGWQQGIAAANEADKAGAQAAATGPLGLPDPIGYTRYRVLKG